MFFCTPFELVVRQTLCIVCFAPLSSLAPIYTDRCHGDTALASFTNSVSIAKHLNAAGIVVREKISIGDDRTQIIETAGRALAGSEVTVITGGLGPTKDDITKKTLAEMFRSEMRYELRVSGHVERMLAERGIEFK